MAGTECGGIDSCGKMKRKLLDTRFARIVPLRLRAAGSFFFVPGIQINLNRVNLNQNGLMSKSEYSQSRWKFKTAVVAVLCALAAVPAAAATDFTMTVASLSPAAVAPGGTSAANITIVTESGFVGPITFGCTVTPSVPGTVSNPVCVVSPATMNASGGAGATITTTSTTTTVSYGITITATDASGTIMAPTLNLTVLSVVQQFTITVQNTVAPGSVPAGSGAEGIISVNPVNGYTTPPSPGGITLYCATITPLVTIPPYCSFSPGSTGNLLTITGNTPAPSTVTINSLGPVTTQCANPLSRHFYALWIGLPMLTLAGLGGAAGRKRSRKAWWLLVGIFVVGAGFLSTPSCSNTNNVCTPQGLTPANTYTFTIVGVDSNGVASSNTGTSAGPTVTLTVTAPTT